MPAAPSADIWALYPALGVLVLIALLFFGAARIIWREIREWQKSQNEERSKEREIQRAWEAEQAKSRDDRWQGFMANVQASYTTDSTANRQQLAEVVRVLDSLVGTVANLTETLHSHIAVDDARFSVLLSDAQKAQIDASLDTPSRPDSRPAKKR